MQLFFVNQQDGFHYTVDFHHVNHSGTEHNAKAMLEDLQDVSVSIQTPPHPSPKKSFHYQLFTFPNTLDQWA